MDLSKGAAHGPIIGLAWDIGHPLQWLARIPFASLLAPVSMGVEILALCSLASAHHIPWQHRTEGSWSLKSTPPRQSPERCE